MSIPNNFSNILIEGNTFDIGYSTLDETTINTYNYTACLNISGDANIINNFISGISSSASNNILTINNGSCNISGNTFIRGSNTVNAYIVTTGTLDQSITQNIFDSSTVNGSDLILVKGLTKKSIYTINKNQTSYKSIELLDGDQGYWDANLFGYVFFNPFPISGNTNVTNSFIVTKAPITSDGYSYPNQHTLLYIGLEASINVGQPIGWNTTIDLTAALPDNVQIISIKNGVSNTTGGTNITTGSSPNDSLNSINMTVTSYPVISDNFTTGTSSILDTKANLSNTQVQSNIISLTNANIINLNSISQYMTMSGFGPEFITNTSVDIIAELHMILTPTNTGSNVFKISPLVVQYRW